MNALRHPAALAVLFLLACILSLGAIRPAWAGPTSLDNDYPSCKTGEIYESAEPQNPGGVEPGGLCYDQCKSGYTGIGVRCYQNCEPGTKDLVYTCLRELDVLAKDTYGRGVGTLMKCKAGEENIAGLCYSACPSGYSNAGFFCAEKCKDGYLDIGLTCGYVYAKETKFRESALPTTCPAGKELDTGLCYTPCQSGYTGALQSCYEICPAGTTDTGLFCYKPGSTLAKDIISRSPYQLSYGSCSSIGKVQIGELCYPACQTGYDSVGIDCHSRCPSGYTDTGLLCTRGADSYKQTRYSRIGDETFLPCNSSEEQKGALCYPKCRSGYASVGLDCEIPCRSGYTDDGLFCTRHVSTVAKVIYSRAGQTSVRPTSCANGGKQIGALCYAQCPASYDEVGFDCHSRCPSGYRNDGLLCTIDPISTDKKYYSRGVGSLPGCGSGQNIAGVCYQPCPSGWDTVGLSCNNRCTSGFKDTGLFCDGTYNKATVTRTSIPGLCGAGEEKDGALCYPVCKSGYTGVGPVCWQNCSQGYNDDGAFCRRPEKIVGKDSYHRGAGRAPDTCDVTSFGPRTPPSPNNPVGPFTMIFASDPQPTWLAGPGDDGSGGNPLYCDDDDCHLKRSREFGRRQVMGMNAILFASSLVDRTRGFWPKSTDAGKSAGKAIRKPQGVIVNGDLTNFWQHDDRPEHDQVKTYRQYFEPAAHYAAREALVFNLYPGLGNHDYSNNVKDCTGAIAHYSFNYGNNACAREAIDYMKTAVSCGHVNNFPTGTVVAFDRDSLAYAFDIGKYRFIQLHNYPTYTRTEIGITNSTSWLKSVLTDAKAKGLRAVLNLHDPGEHWSPGATGAVGKAAPDDPLGSTFTDAIDGQDVVAIFAGHFHWKWGRQTSYDVTVGSKTIPVFLSGASEYDRFLLVEFGPDYFTVGVINASTGLPVFETSTNSPNPTPLSSIRLP